MVLFMSSSPSSYICFIIVIKDALGSASYKLEDIVGIYKTIVYFLAKLR